MTKETYSGKEKTKAHKNNNKKIKLGIKKKI